ncbi:MAG: GTP-binding protein, partial [Thermoanaerobaculia bacterium]|nr:GTP-binding protein [Thermoanaerobaculia bacterium]
KPCSTISGAINRIGRVEEKNTVSDWDEEEKERGLSLSTSLVPIEFNEYKINLLDTPGYTDFQGEVKNAIRVADSVIVVVDAVSGVEVGTELAWEYAEVYQQPIIVTINKMDRENASFERTMDSLRANFPEYKFIPVMIPIGAQADFKGVVNLLTMKAYYGAGADRSDLPPDMADAAQVAHTVLVEAAAEAGASYASYVMLRLPHAVSEIFSDWLEHHYPDRKEKVLAKVREMRGGQLNDARFGKRMKGEGVYAQQIRQLFRMTLKRLGLADRHWPEVSSAAFRKPGEQLGLFG